MLSNPIHTDIALPASPDVLDTFGFLAGAGLPMSNPSVRWLVAGWGSREFYLETPTWADLRPGPLLKGLTLDRSVMHVSLAGEIDPGAPGIVAVDISLSQFDAIVEQVLAGFARDESGQPVLIEGRSYGEFDRFYEGEGRFTALLGCNTWTGAVLRMGGLRTGFWNPLPQSLGWSLALFNDLPERQADDSPCPAGTC